MKEDTQKDCKKQSWRMILQKSVFFTQRGRFTYELTETVTVYTRAAHVKARQNPA